MRYLLENKADFGVRLKAAYDAGDKKTLALMAEECEVIIEKIEALKLAHREAWFAHNKAFGWEIHDIRYGGLKLRFESVKERINDYLNGVVQAIEELEAERLSFNGAPAGKFNKNFVWQRYTSIASVSRFN